MSFWKTMPARRGIKLSARECCMLLWLGLPPLLFFGRISVSMLWAWKCAHVLTQKQVCTSSLSWGYILQITYMNVKGAFQNNNTGKEWGPDLMILSELLKVDFQQSDLNVKEYILLSLWGFVAVGDVQWRSGTDLIFSPETPVTLS